MNETNFLLFPTLVSKYQSVYSLTDLEKDYIINLKMMNNQNNLSSEECYLLDDPILTGLRQALSEYLTHYFNKLYDPVQPLDVYITQSWSNITLYQQSHHKHNHPNSVVSGVYYVQVDHDTDRIYFSKHKHDIFHIVSKEYKDWNSDSWWIPIENESLILFPSDLHHFVPPVESDLPRVSISFNAFISGNFGNPTTRTAVTL